MECKNWERNWKLKNRAKGIKFATRRLENSIKSAQNLLHSALMVLKLLSLYSIFCLKIRYLPLGIFGGGGVLILSFGL